MAKGNANRRADEGDAARKPGAARKRLPERLVSNPTVHNDDDGDGTRDAAVLASFVTPAHRVLAPPCHCGGRRMGFY